jgi:dihydroorotase
MSIKTIDAVVATSNYVRRQQVQFDTETGLITDVGFNLVSKEKVDHFFDDDCLLFAGMGDIHIHAREDLSGKNCYKEDFISTQNAALNGGVVHVADMPNNPIAPIDDESYLAKLQLSLKSEVPILMYAGIGPSTKPLSFEVPYKAYMGPSIGDLFFKDNQALDETLSHYKNQWVSFHCEDPEILEECKSCQDHFKRRPIRAEIMATNEALKLAEKYNLKAKLCHYSAKEGLNAIRAAKRRGLTVSCEVTPQHLFFNEQDIRQLPEVEQISFQMNPPIRGSEDQEALINALKAGDIDYLATDHAPHSPEEKARGTSGLTGLDTYGAFTTWLMILKGFKPEDIARVACENPGRFHNQFLPTLSSKFSSLGRFGRGFGFIEKNYSASFTILNTKRPLTVTKSMLKTKAQSSPFLGVTFPGSVEAVFLCGIKKTNSV